MRFEKATWQCMLVTLLLSTGCEGAQSGPTVVLKGSQVPTDQGWSVSTNAVPPLDVAIRGKHITLNTIEVQRMDEQSPGHTFMWFYKEVPFDFEPGFAIEFTLKVHAVEEPHNYLDAGIMFYGSTDTADGMFTGGPRDQMIYFDENGIGWGDETETFAMDTTDTFHAYTLRVENKGVAKVYVDGTLRLTRKNWIGIPRIGFGDMTNDLGVNGRFSIGDIIVTAYPHNSPSRPARRRSLIPPSRSAPK